MPDFDLIVIGSGPAGEKGAVQAAYFGKRVALIEAQPRLGGACVNTGTLPSKTLRETALYLSGLDQRGLYGVDYRLDVTLDRFMYRKQRVITSQLELVGNNIDRHNVELIQGRAEVVDPHTVRIQGPGGAVQTLTGEFILIATGSYPFRPGSIPFDDTTIYDSDTVLQLDKIPGSMTIIGAGVIGCEYACIFAALGVEVKLVDGRDRILPFIDDEIGDCLSRQMKKLGIQFVMPEEMDKVEALEGRIRTTFKSGKAIETERFLYAAGRSGNTRGLGLEKLGVEVNKRGQITVNGQYQTAVPNIYAAGDVIGFPALASTSMEQGRIAACHAFDLKYKTSLDPILPYGLYTIPEVSMAGDPEEDLQKKGIPYVVGRAYYRYNSRGQITGDLEGLIKLLAAPEDGKLLGVHIIGENATELVHIGQTCMHFGGSIETFIRMVFNYPTLSEIYKYAAYDALGKIAKLRKDAAIVQVQPMDDQTSHEANGAATPQTEGVPAEAGPKGGQPQPA